MKNNLKPKNNSQKDSSKKGVVWRLFFRNWKFISLAVFTLIIGGTVVYFSAIPQSVRSKTFTFFQTAWTSVAATATHSPDAQDKTTIATYDSKDAQISVSPDTDVTLAPTAGQDLDTSDTDFSGAHSSTATLGSGDSASVKLNPIPGATAGTYTSGVIDTGQNSDFTTVEWTSSDATLGTSTTTKWDQTTNNDFSSGTTANTIISNSGDPASIKLDSSWVLVP